MFTSPIHPCVRVPARARAQDHCNCFISLSGMLFVTANIREVSFAAGLAAAVPRG